MVVLVNFEQEHIEKTFEWVLQEELRKMFLIRGEPTRSSHEAYFNKVLSDNTQKVFAILWNRKHVGNCGMKHIAHSTRSGELWVYIGDPVFRGKGIGNQSTAQLIDFGVNSLGLELIYLHVAEFNIAARNLYKSLGFKEVDSEFSKDWADRDFKVIKMELHKSSISTKEENF